MGLHLKWPVALILSFTFNLQVFALPPKMAPKFKKQSVEFVYKNKRKEVVLDAAESELQHAYGLMNRTKMAADEGMIFIFPDENIREFWMKDTLIDLDIAYVSAKKKIIDIQNMKAVTSVLQTNLPTYPSGGPAKYAIEMNSGWFKKNGFPVGTIVDIPPRPTSKK
jgi:uncharacterized membrane protein (UPF0127 family)